MDFTFRGHKCRLERPSQMGDRLGECSPPSSRTRVVRVLKSLRGRRELEVLIHEMLHLAFWDLDEACVERTAADMARVLSRCGYKREAQ